MFAAAIADITPATDPDNDGRGDYQAAVVLRTDPANPGITPPNVEIMSPENGSSGVWIP